jgi:hypothetical protein
MKTITLFASILCLIGCIQVTNAEIIRQPRHVPNFHGVSVSSGVDLILSQKNVEEVTVEANSEDVDKIITEVEGGILKIYVKEKSWLKFDWKSKPRKVHVSFKTLDNIDASAGSDVVSEGSFKLDKLKIDASSGSDIKLELDATEIQITSSSGSDILLKGNAINVNADASSGSDINAGELHAKRCNVNASSGSDVKVYASEAIDANASSAGDVYYYGNPKSKNVNESSGGDVKGK